MFEYRERGREVRAAFCTNSKFIAACYMLVRSCVGLCVRNGEVGRGRGDKGSKKIEVGVLFLLFSAVYNGGGWKGG
jgi:hypothetical protein